MSAIDFHAEVNKVQEKGVDRVQIVLNGQWRPVARGESLNVLTSLGMCAGKWLPYSKF